MAQRNWLTIFRESTIIIFAFGGVGVSSLATQLYLMILGVKTLGSEYAVYFLGIQIIFMAIIITHYILV